MNLSANLYVNWSTNWSMNLSMILSRNLTRNLSMKLQIYPGIYLKSTILINKFIHNPQSALINFGSQKKMHFWWIRGGRLVLGIGFSVFWYYQKWKFRYRYRITEWLCKFTKILVLKVGVGTCCIGMLSLFESLFEGLEGLFESLLMIWSPFDSLKPFEGIEGLLKAFLWPFENLQSFFSFFSFF